MNGIASARRRRWVARRVRRGVVVVDGRTYCPVPDGVPYDGQLDGHRCLFVRHPRPDGTPAPGLALWGTWDDEMRDYLDNYGPHRVGDRYPFATWSVVEEIVA